MVNSENKNSDNNLEPQNYQELTHHYILSFSTLLCEQGHYEFNELCDPLDKPLPQQTFQEELNRRCQRFDSLLKSETSEQIKKILLANLLEKQIKQLEEELFSFLSQCAKQHMNQVTLIPSVATLATISILKIRPFSLSSGPFKTDFYSLLSHLNAIFDRFIMNASEKTDFSKTKFFEPFSYIETQFIQQIFRYFFVSIEQTTFIFNTFIEKIFSNVDVSKTLNPLESEEIIQKINTCMNEIKQHPHFINRINQYLISEEIENCALGILKMFDNTKLAIENARKILQHSLVSQDRQNTLYENMIFIKRLAFYLEKMNENSNEIQALTDKLFIYVRKNAILCHELLDEEIHGLHPLISRENITKAKLEIRLNDIDYPLSVAHRNWTLQTLQDPQCQRTSQ
ncbi:MAG: hypothetical protein K2X39_08700 [Silvanigrellaceae bacterium]|nr:hypothetical protein [Silvanigrellaceae bacterium]